MRGGVPGRPQGAWSRGVSQRLLNQVPLLDDFLVDILETKRHHRNYTQLATSLPSDTHPRTPRLLTPYSILELAAALRHTDTEQDTCTAPLRNSSGLMQQICDATEAPLLKLRANRQCFGGWGGCCCSCW